MAVGRRRPNTPIKKPVKKPAIICTNRLKLLLFVRHGLRQMLGG
jgi:hypothetical protein